MPVYYHPLQPKPHPLKGILSDERIAAAEKRIRWEQIRQDVREHTRQIALRAPPTAEERILTGNLKLRQS